MDFDGLCLDHDVVQPTFNQVAVIRRSWLLTIVSGRKTLTKRLDHEVLDVRCWHAGHAASLTVSFLQKRVGDIVAVARAPLVRVRRGHAVAAVVENAAGKGCR